MSALNTRDPEALLRWATSQDSWRFDAAELTRDQQGWFRRFLRVARPAHPVKRWLGVFDEPGLFRLQAQRVAYVIRHNWRVLAIRLAQCPASIQTAIAEWLRQMPPTAPGAWARNLLVAIRELQAEGRP